MPVVRCSCVYSLTMPWRNLHHSIKLKLLEQIHRIQYRDIVYIELHEVCTWYMICQKNPTRLINSTFNEQYIWISVVNYVRVQVSDCFTCHTCYWNTPPVSPASVRQFYSSGLGRAHYGILFFCRRRRMSPNLKTRVSRNILGFSS